MINMSFMLTTIAEALLFGSNSINKCEQQLNNLNLADFEDYSSRELQNLAEGMEELKPEFDKMRKMILEKAVLVDIAYKKLSNLYFGIHGMITEKNETLAVEGEKGPSKEKKKESSTSLSDEKVAPEAQPLQTFKSAAPERRIDQENDSEINKDPHKSFHKDFHKYFSHCFTREEDKPVFQMDFSNIWKIDYIVDLYQKLTHHQTNQFALIKALITIDFDELRKYFRSRNLFFVWLNTLLLSHLITSQREWLHCFLHSDKTKLFRDALRKCRNKDVLNCCVKIKIALNFNQRMWSENELTRN